MKNYFLLTLLIIISSISFSQTINGRLGEFETSANPFDSTLFVTLQIKLNEYENEVLGHTFNLKVVYDLLALEFIEGSYINFNEADGYKTSTITSPGASGTIQNIETKLVSGPGREVTDVYIDFVVFEFKIIDFSRAGSVCPSNNSNGFHFYSTNSTQDWIIGEWLCYEGHTPVELTSFTTVVSNGFVKLSWITSTEINNSGFEVQRSAGGEFETLAFVEGHGTTTESQAYSYNDRNVNAGTYTYRLKQVDFDGSFEYSNAIEVDVPVLQEFSLEQNFPNPFNPNTKIKYSVPQSSIVELTVFDILGNEIETLVTEEKPVGTYEITWHAANLPSGVYFYQLRAGDFVETKKMVLMR